MATPYISEPERVWHDIFKNKVEKDDPLWKEYVEKAATFDERMVDEWNKIVDVILVYVALFISVLTSFVIQTSSQLQKDPAAITNDLLVAIYNQLAAQANNVTIPVVNTDSLFILDRADRRNAVECNALLYTSLALCTVVSVIALAAKLWLVSYSHRAFSVGSPYERAMRRQEAYSGILAWKMGTVINTMPLILLIALILFGFFVHTSVTPLQQFIGYIVGTILSLGLISLGVTSIGAAFVPACPFRSIFSSAIELLFEIPWVLLQTILSGVLGIKIKKVQSVWNGCLVFLWVAYIALVAYAALNLSSACLILIFLPVAITLAYAARQEVDHDTQDYMIPHLSGWAIVLVELMLAAAAYFTGSITNKYPIFITLYGLGMVVLILSGWLGSGMSKSMAKTGEIDAIAWLLRSTPSQDPTFFKKAGQMVSLSVDYNGRLPVDCNSSQYRPRLLKSLMPLLSLLITSHHAPEPDADPLSPSQPNPTILEEKDKLRSEDPLVGLIPEVQADPVAMTSHHHLNADPSSLSSKERLKLLAEKKIKTAKLQFDNLPIAMSPVQADPVIITSRHVPQGGHYPDPSSPSSKTMPKLLEERNIKLKKLRSESLRTILSPVEAKLDATLDAIDEEIQSLQHLEIYVSCLALLSEFKDDEGSFRCLWEDAKRHPQLEDQLRDKLVELADAPYHLRAAVDVLKNYGLDSRGYPFKDPSAPKALKPPTGVALAVGLGSHGVEATVNALV